MESFELIEFKMINYRKSALVILFTFTLTEIYAQLRSEYLIGVNLSTLTIKINGVNINPKTCVGIHFGGFYEIPVRKHFTLQPSFIFSAKGTDYKIDTLSISLAPAYIEVPVNLSLSFDISSAKVSLYSGPYFAYAFGGYKSETGSQINNISYGSGQSQDLRPFDFGLNLGTRVKLKSFEIAIQYGLGLKNISPVKSFDSEMKNRVIGISIIRNSRVSYFKPGR
jgi:hypothetical protein